MALLLGLQTAPSASVSLWLNLETTATALLAWAFFRENMDGRTWVANLLVLTAGVMLAAPENFAVAPSALLIGLACVCWGLDNNFTAVIDGYTPAQTTCAKGLVAGLEVLPVRVSRMGLRAHGPCLFGAAGAGARVLKNDGARISGGRR